MRCRISWEDTEIRVSLYTYFQILRFYEKKLIGSLLKEQLKYQYIKIIFIPWKYVFFTPFFEKIDVTRYVDVCSYNQSYSPF